MDAAVTFNTFYCAYLLTGGGDGAAHIDFPKGHWVLRATFAAYTALALAIYVVNQEALTGNVFVLGIGGAIVLASLHALLYSKAPDQPRVAILGGTVLMLACGLASWWEEYWFQTCRWSTRNPIQPHALWHFFTAATLVLAYCYMRAMGASSWRQARAALFLGDEGDREENGNGEENNDPPRSDGSGASSVLPSADGREEQQGGGSHGLGISF